MEFCPECGSLFNPKKTAKNQTEEILICSKCGRKQRVAGEETKPKTGKIIKHDIKQLVTVIGKEEQKINTMPTLRVECPKCGNNLVYVWQVQTRGGDESSTQFFRCTKCSHTFREYT
jgi:transcription factor S